MHVSLIAATSIDGFIAPVGVERSFEWTSAEDKQFYVSMLKKSDAIVMGSKTFKTFSRYPKGSRWIIYTSSPESFENRKTSVMQSEGTNESPKELIERLEKEGCREVAICGGASIYSMFMNAGVVDTLYLTIEPVVFGRGVKLFSEEVRASLQLVKVEQLGESTVLLEYKTKS